MSTPKLAFTHIFYETLEASGKSLAQLARELTARGFKISKGTLSRWKAGLSFPSRESLLLLRELPNLLGMTKEQRQRYRKALEALFGTDPTPQNHTIKHRHNTLGALTFFTGREREQKALLRLLPKQSLVLCGLGGIGKTTLARQLLILQEPNFLHGCEALKLTSHHTPSLVVEEVAHHLNVSLNEKVTPQNISASLKEIQNWTSDLKIIFLLDNVEEERQIQELVQALPHIRWLLTARKRLHLKDFQLYPLTPPSLAAATRMVLHYAQMPSTPRQRSLAKQIAQRLGCLPIALYLAAGMLNTKIFASVNELLVWLNAEGLEIFQHQLDDEKLLVFFEKMIAYQPRAIQDYFTLCGAFATPRINRQLFEQTATTSGLPPQLLRPLATLSLIQWSPDEKHFDLHPLVHEYAVSRWQKSPAYETQQKNFALCGAQFAKAHRADRQITQAALPDLYRAVAYAEKQNDWELLEQFWHDLTYHHSEMSEWESYRQLDERCLAVARAHHDQRNECAILLELAWVAYLESRWEDTARLCQETRQLCTQLHLSVEYARACGYHVLALLSQKKYPDAQQQLAEMKLCLTQEGTHQSVSDISFKNVWVRYHHLQTKLQLCLTHYPAALTEAQQGLALAQNLQDVYREKQLGAQLGDALYLLEQRAEGYQRWSELDNYNFEKYNKRDPAMHLRFAIYEYQNGEPAKALRRHAHPALRLAHQSHKVVLSTQAAQLIKAIKAKEDVQALLQEIICA